MPAIGTMSDSALRRHLLDTPTAALLAEARARRDARGPARTTWSRKVFIPLTQLCADTCHYCTFAKAPRGVHAPYLLPEQVLDIARRGAQAGCKEALFTLGDAPERRYRAAREALAALGFTRTIDYLAHVAGLVLAETGLLPHINAGILSADDYRLLRPVSASAGLMLESSSDRLCARGGPHFGSPDKVPATRLASIAAAGDVRVPMTSGVLIGIGETEDERSSRISRPSPAPAWQVSRRRATKISTAPSPAPGSSSMTKSRFRRRPTSTPNASLPCSTPASTIGAASRRSRSIM
jgi:FO synthase